MTPEQRERLKYIRQYLDFGTSHAIGVALEHIDSQAAEIERLKNEVATLSRLGGYEDAADFFCAHGNSTCDVCSAAWSHDRRKLEPQLADTRKAALEEAALSLLRPDLPLSFVDAARAIRALAEKGTPHG